MVTAEQLLNSLGPCARIPRAARGGGGTKKDGFVVDRAALEKLTLG
jgi:hypothetical protein